MGWNPMMKGCEKGFTHQRALTGWKPVPHDQSPDGNGGVGDGETEPGAPATGSTDDTGETPVIPEETWEQYYEWVLGQCWGPNCETTGSEQFRAAMQKKLELGLPLEREW